MVKNMDAFEFHLPVDEYRTLPVPFYGLGDGRQPKLATCFVRASEIPDALKEWMSVNPRIPRFNKKDELTGSVARAIVTTLMEEPEKFVIKNQGIYLLTEKANHTKETGGQGILTLRFSDPQRHGLVNGGHTFQAIRQVAEDPDRLEPWEPYVRLHIFEMGGANSSVITEMAEGLNRSLQVDNPSLENLRGTFDEIRNSLQGKLGYEQIAYRQGDSGDVDIQQVLMYMSLLNIKKFPDRKTHPHTIFSQSKVVLDTFIEDIKPDNKSDNKSDDSAFKRMIPHLHEILVLTDSIQKLAVEQQTLGRLKVSNAKKQNRVRSEKNKNRPAYFAGGVIGGNLPAGLLYPMLAAFRANISPKAWNEGRFEWLAEPQDLLKATIEEMAQIVRQEYDDNKSKPAEVGRKEAAYRGCYGVLFVELAQRNLLAN
nr:AIPR family protein [Hassalia byssoidea]